MFLSSQDDKNFPLLFQDNGRKIKKPEKHPK